MPGPTTVRYGGNTTCFEVWAGENLIIVDAGTGIIGLGKEMVAKYREAQRPIRAALLFTHLHHDHTQGLPFFLPLRHPKSTLYIFGAKPGETTSLEANLIQHVQPPFFPLGMEEMYSRRYIRHIRGGDRIVLCGLTAPPYVVGVQDDVPDVPADAVTVDVHHGYHHPQNGVLMFRVNYRGRSLVVATDTEGYVGGDQRLIRFAQGADLLVHDAEYDEAEYSAQKLVRQGWGHSTWRMAVEVAQAAGVKRLALCHHNTNHDDAFLDEIERKAQALFPETFMAREGLAVPLL